MLYALYEPKLILVLLVAAASLSLITIRTPQPKPEKVFTHNNFTKTFR